MPTTCSGKSIIAIAFIGARQHDLATMIHEATHYRLARNRRVNEWLGEALVAARSRSGTRALYAKATLAEIFLLSDRIDLAKTIINESTAAEGKDMLLEMVSMLIGLIRSNSSSREV